MAAYSTHTGDKGKSRGTLKRKDRNDMQKTGGNQRKDREQEDGDYPHI